MKILIIRSAPFTVFTKALKKIREQYPEAKISVLVQCSCVENLASYEEVLFPIIIEDGSFSLLKEGMRLLPSIRKEQFDLTCLLYNNLDGKGYLSIDLFSFFAGTKGEVICDRGGNFYSVSSRPLKLAKRVLHLIGGRTLFAFISASLWYWTVKKKLFPDKFVLKKISSSPLSSENPLSKKKLLQEKKIVFIDLMFSWPPHGGACVDLKEVACRLYERGYKVELIVPDFGEKSFLFSTVNSGLFTRGKVEDGHLPFPVHKISFSAWSYNCFVLPKKIKKKVDELRPDYVYLGDSYFLKPYLIEALKNYQTVTRFYMYELLCPNRFILGKDGKNCSVNYLSDPLHCTKCAIEGMKESFSTLNLDIWSFEILVSFIFLPSYYQRVVRTLSSCNSLITYNELGRRLLSQLNERVIIIPGGVNVNSYTPSYEKKGGIKKIFLSGRLMDPKKGLEFFIKTVRSLRKERDDFHVYLTHDQPFPEEYITSLGWVNHDRIKEIYQTMDFCVVPSMWEEPFGIVAPEAMAAGKPVVASRVEGLKMSVQNGVTGFLFSPGDHEELKECMNRLLDSPDLMKSMGKAGRKRAEEYFDWENIVDLYCQEIFI